MGNPNMIRNTWYNLICVDCGSSFSCRVSTAKRCESCRDKLKKSRFKTHRSVPIKRSPKHCERCNEEFVPRSNNVRFCDKCKEVIKNLRYLRKPILKCPTCGSFYIKTGNFQKRCEICGYKQLYAGDYRTIAFENLPHICNRCGIKVDLFSADVHHKDRNRQNNNLDNLEILCKSCHHKEHMIRDARTGKIITNR